MLRMEIGGVEFLLDPSAISAVRYRVECGDSIVNHLADCESEAEREGLLLRMCHLMIPAAHRPELLDFAKLARADGGFVSKGMRAISVLLSHDPLSIRVDGDADGESFDEYIILATMAEIGLGTALLYELPIMHIVSIINRYAERQDTERTTYRKLTPNEMASLYPR